MAHLRNVATDVVVVSACVALDRGAIVEADEAGAFHGTRRSRNRVPLQQRLVHAAGGLAEAVMGIVNVVALRRHRNAGDQ